MSVKSWSVEMARHAANRVTSDPGIMMGKPVITGTRIPVELILRRLGAGDSEQQILADHPHLTIDDIRAAQAFAADHLASEDERRTLRRQAVEELGHLWDTGIASGPPTDGEAAFARIKSRLDTKRAEHPTK
jgi:uncharacterized protein (DUF433 family)